MTELQNDLSLLNASLDGEYFGIAAYQAAVNSGLLSDGVRQVAEKFQSDHKAHAGLYREAILELGGTPVETKSWAEYAAAFPPPALKSQADILRYAASLESSSASGTLGTVAKFSTPKLAELAASIVGVEAMHWAVLRNALGETPVPGSVIALPESIH
jgi:Ferritin-like domain